MLLSVFLCLAIQGIVYAKRVAEKFEVINGNYDSRLVGSTMITYTENGILMHHSEDHTIGSTLHFAKEYELLYINAVLQLIPLSYTKDDIFLDIGANIGTWTVPLANAINPFGGRVYSFEAILDTYYFLGANIALNGLQNVNAFNVALGDKPETRLVPKNDYTSGANLGGFSISIFDQVFGGVAGSGDGKTSESFDSTRYQEVTIDTVDNLMDRGVIPSCPVFMKIDVELHEPYVIKGALETIKKCMPAIFFELDCELHANAIIPQLIKMGYDVVYLPFVTVRPSNPWVAKLFSYGNISEAEILTMVFGSAYAFAVRKELSEAVFANPAVNSIPVNLTKGALVKEYGIERCMANPRDKETPICRILVQLPNINSTCNLCSFTDVDSDGFWEV